MMTLKSQKQEMFKKFVTADANPKAHLQDNFEPSRTLTYNSNPEPQKKISQPQPPTPVEAKARLRRGETHSFSKRMF